jgi:hypothetical protein
LHLQPHGHEQQRERGRCHQQGHHRHVVAVDDRDHHQRREVVDDEDGHQEDPHPLGHLAAHQGEHAEGQGGVGRHRDAPAVGTRAPVVEGEVDQHRHSHRHQAGRERQDETTSLAQVAEVELAACLQPDHQEEQRHQPAVDPGAQVVRRAHRAQAQRELRVPELLVGRGVDVGPEQGQDDTGQEHAGTARLGLQERAQRCGAATGPQGATPPGGGRSGLLNRVTHRWPRDESTDHGQFGTAPGGKGSL